MPTKRATWALVVGFVALGLLAMRLCHEAEPKPEIAPAAPAATSPARNKRLARLARQTKGVDLRDAVRRSLTQDRGPAIALFIFGDVDPLGQLWFKGRVVNSNDQGVGGVEVVMSGVPTRTAVTEADGSFYFEELIPQLYRLYARGTAGTAGPLSFQLTARTEPVTLVLQAGGELMFAVKTPQGEPIANATVAMSAYEAVLGADAPAFAVTGQTDAAGQLVFRQVPYVMMRYRVTAEGYASPDFDFTQVPALRHEIDVVLEPAAALHGLVLQPDGAPAPSACVKRFVDSPCLASTDAAGKFTLAPRATPTDGISKMFIASHPQLGWMMTTDGARGEGTEASPFVLTLAPYRSVAGVVARRSGEPVANALVRVGLSLDQNASAPIGGLVASDAQGQFTLLIPSDRAMSVVAFDGNHTSNTATISAAEASPAPLELRMLDGAASEIRGRVLMASGEAAEGAQVSARLATSAQGTGDGAATLRGQSTALTSTDGTFHLTGLEPDEYELTAWDANSAGRRYPAGKIKVLAGSDRADIYLPAWGAVVAVAHQAGGLPVTSQVCLRLAATPSPPSKRRSTCAKNSEGKVRFDGVEVGSYTLEVDATGYAPVTRPVTIARANELVDVGTVVLEPQ